MADNVEEIAEEIETVETSSKIPSGYRDILESNALAHIATVGPDGEPQNNPVWFGYDGTNLMFSQTTGRQKFKNLEAEPRIAMSIVDKANDYRYIEIRGRVVRVDQDPDFAFINSMAKKYIGADEYPWHQPGDVRVIMVVEVEHTTQTGG